LIADFDGRFEQRHIGLAIVVRACAEMRPLGDGDILTDGDRSKVVNERAFANGAPVADSQVPGKVDYSRTVDMDVVSDLRAKQPENATSPAKEWPRAEAKEQLTHAPEDAAQQFGARVFRGLSISGNVESGLHWPVVREQPADKGRQRSPIRGKDLKAFMRDENLIGSHPLFLPMLFQLVHGNPMRRVTIIQSSSAFLAVQGIPHVPKVYHVCNNMVLLVFRQTCQLCFNLFQCHSVQGQRDIHNFIALGTNYHFRGGSPVRSFKRTMRFS